MGLSSPSGLSRAGLIPRSFSFIILRPYMDEHICIYLGLSAAPLFQGRPCFLDELRNTMSFSLFFFFFWNSWGAWNPVPSINCTMTAWHASWPRVLLRLVGESCFRWGPFQFFPHFSRQNLFNPLLFFSFHFFILPLCSVSLSLSLFLRFSVF